MLLLYKFSICHHFLSQKKEMATLIISYLIQNHCSKERQMIQEINSYLQIDGNSLDYKDLLEKEKNLLIEEKIISKNIDGEEKLVLNL